MKLHEAVKMLLCMIFGFEIGLLVMEPTWIKIVCTCVSLGLVLMVAAAWRMSKDTTGKYTGPGDQPAQGEPRQRNDYHAEGCKLDIDHDGKCIPGHPEGGETRKEVHCGKGEEIPARTISVKGRGAPSGQVETSAEAGEGNDGTQGWYWRRK